MTALNNTAVLVADIYDPDGRPVDWIFFGWLEPSTESIKITDPMSGTWRVDVWPIFADGSTKEYYSGSYDVLSKDTSWINTPQDLFIPAMSQEVFTSTLTPTGDASGDYTGGITVSGSGMNIEIPVAVSVGESITYPGNFIGDDANNAWRYYIVDVNSDYLNTSIEWDNVHNDLDLFIFDPSGAATASSTRSDTVQEAVTIPDPVSGTWTIGIYGHSITDIQQFLGTVC